MSQTEQRVFQIKNQKGEIKMLSLYRRYLDAKEKIKGIEEE